MSLLNDLKAGTKLIGGIALVLVMLLVVAVLGWQSTSALSANVRTEYADSLQATANLGTVERALWELRLGLANYSAGDDQSRAQIKTDTSKWLQQIDDNMKKYGARALSPDAQTALKDWNQFYADYGRTRPRFIELIDQGKNDEAATWRAQQANPAAAGSVAALGRLTQLEQQQAAARQNAVAASANSASAVALVLAGFGLVLGLGVAFLLVRSLTQPLNQLTLMIQEMSRGHLNMRLGLNRRDEIGVMAQALDRFGDDLQNNLVGAMKRIAAGDLTATVQPKDAQDEIAPALAGTIASLQSLVSQTQKLTRATTEGHLSVRGDPDQFQGSYREIVQGLNDTLDAVVEPLRVAAKYVEQISKGDIPPRITDTYQGDFNEIKNGVNALIDSLNGLIVEMSGMYEAQTAGDMDAYLSVEQFSGMYRAVAQGMNEAVKLHVDTILRILRILGSYAEGDFGPILDPLPGKQAIANEKLDLLRNNLRGIVVEANALTKAATEGRLENRADASKFKGDWNVLVQGLNDTLDAIVGPTKMAADYMDRISKGDIPAKITDNYSGDFNAIKNNLNQCIDAVNLLVIHTKLLSQAAQEGKLTTRADASRHQGEYRKIIEGINSTLDAVIAPMTDTRDLLIQIARGDLTIAMNGHYKGDYEMLKDSVETMVAGLRNSVDQTQKSSVNMTSATAEILASATQMASVTREQASAVNQITATVQEIKASAEQVAQQAQSVATEAMEARAAAEQGTAAVQATIAGMTDIRQKVEAIAENILALSEQSQQIGDIIDTVTDIAGQSNILALNAAIEAAQAGEAGKGFRVVADEVRSLAEQSRQAAAQVKVILGDIQKATNLAVMATEQGTKGVNEGSELVNRAAHTISELSKVVETAAQSAQQIVAGVEQQTIGLDQIVIGMSDINQAAQQSAMGAQQSQKASQDLTTLADELKQVVAQYRL